MLSCVFFFCVITPYISLNEQHTAEYECLTGWCDIHGSLPQMTYSPLSCLVYFNSFATTVYFISFCLFDSISFFLSRRKNVERGGAHVYVQSMCESILGMEHHLTIICWFAKTENNTKQTSHFRLLKCWASLFSFLLSYVLLLQKAFVFSFFLGFLNVFISVRTLRFTYTTNFQPLRYTIFVYFRHDIVDGQYLINRFFRMWLLMFYVMRKIGKQTFSMFSTKSLNCHTLSLAIGIVVKIYTYNMGYALLHEHLYSFKFLSAHRTSRQ